MNHFCTIQKVESENMKKHICVSNLYLILITRMQTPDFEEKLKQFESADPDAL